ncbi:MAG: Crp/Fnr family transcriptional regulator [Alphaproteobacteria bacterium]|nr:Crp/Fnr family transcriptional regulator [Alphaproteobacteria bacterium]
MTRVANEQGVGQSGRSLDALRSATLFAGLSDQELACFQNAGRFGAYKKGKILYLQDDPADFFYVIANGWIKLFQTMPEGEEIIIDMLAAGDTVGEGAIFEQGLHTSSAQVVESVKLFSIPSSLLKEQVHLKPTLALRLLSSMSQRHRQHYSDMALNAIKSAPQRVGCFLLRLCPQDQDRAIISLPYNKSLIASVLGMKGATFSRALNVLRQKTDVRIYGTRVEIDSVETLSEFVYGSLYKFCAQGEEGYSMQSAAERKIANRPMYS